jgi:hypothetical protein
MYCETMSPLNGDSSSLRIVVLEFADGLKDRNLIARQVCKTFVIFFYKTLTIKNSAVLSSHRTPTGKITKWSDGYCMDLSNGNFLFAVF